MAAARSNAWAAASAAGGDGGEEARGLGRIPRLPSFRSVRSAAVLSRSGLFRRKVKGPAKDDAYCPAFSGLRYDHLRSVG